ncbi:MAG TPA: TIM barrel protein [Bryobacterales bacterium]|nr:TIM barrel protein [Bryobacterales bacterium]
MTRRTWLAALAAASAAAPQELKPTPRKGRLKQCVTRGVFGRNMPFDEMCRHAARLGVVGFDLIGPEDFPVLKKYGLIPTMVPGAMTLTGGFNHKEDHPAVEKALRELIDNAAAAGAPNVIALSGNRRGISDQEGMDNVVALLSRVKGQAEDRGVNVCLELLNSKVNHPDYQCDHTAWGVEVCRRVNSPRVKLLFDIYHMQIMEGDIIRTIRGNFQWIAHFHTAGNPGRHEMDDNQEMNYRGIARAIADLGFQGYIAHEYSPLRDPIQSLEETLAIFTV